MTSAKATTDLPWVIVRLGPTCFAMPSHAVREILPLPRVSRVPGLPPDLPGIIQWRGSVVPVVDLAVRLRLPPMTQEAGAPSMGVVVVGGDPARHAALAVEAVVGVEALAPGSMTPLPEGLEMAAAMVGYHARLKRDGTLVLVLDLAATLGYGEFRDATVDTRDAVAALFDAMNGMEAGSIASESAPAMAVADADGPLAVERAAPATRRPRRPARKPAAPVPAPEIPPQAPAARPSRRRRPS